MEDVTAEAMEDGADEFTYLLEVAGFTKTIESEVSAKEAETHLLDLRDEHEEWKEFSERDVKLLARIFGVLKFENKESIMKQGEGATFFGILLSGSALITVNLPDKKKLNFPLTKGGVLGEMAYFEGGARSADVNASGAQPTLFAVMTYDDLEKLHEVSGQLQSKLVVMFATKSLEKQRKNLTSASDKKKAEKVSRRRNTGVMESALKRRSMMPKKRNPASNSSLTEDKQAKELRRLQAQMANMKLEQVRIFCCVEGVYVMLFVFPHLPRPLCLYAPTNTPNNTPINTPTTGPHRCGEERARDQQVPEDQRRGHAAEEGDPADRASD
jgi:CRP-like cAMP-binding protein